MAHATAGVAGFVLASSIAAASTVATAESATVAAAATSTSEAAATAGLGAVASDVAHFATLQKVSLVVSRTDHGDIPCSIQRLTGRRRRRHRRRPCRRLRGIHGRYVQLPHSGSKSWRLSHPGGTRGLEKC